MAHSAKRMSRAGKIWLDFAKKARKTANAPAASNGIAAFSRRNRLELGGQGFHEGPMLLRD
jgi:hypothetical protein